MTLPVTIEDSGTTVSITPERELRTSSVGFPPVAVNKTFPFSQFLTDDGTPTGDSDMVVDGSGDPVDFVVSAPVDADRYVTTLSLIVGYGTSGKPYQWADGAALTNGVLLTLDDGTGESELHSGIKSNQDLFRVSTNFIPANWELRHVNANNDFGYILSIDLKVVGSIYGLKLASGSNNRLIIRIRDDMTVSTDSFDCRAYGFDRIL